MPLQTTRASLRRHLQNIPWSVVPQTFRDAVTIATRLGYRYIWNDALCIVQDDPAEWRTEAGKMASVYAGAAIALSALDGVDSCAGIFAERRFRSIVIDVCQMDPAYSHRCPFSFPKPKIGIRFVSGWEFHNWPLEKAAVSQRGWTFQERLLAPAVLHYGSHHIIWECHTHSVTEDGYASLADSLLKALTWSQNSFFHSVICDESQRGLHESWYRLVEEYSLRNLTFASDKLLALEASQWSIEKGWERDTSLAYGQTICRPGSYGMQPLIFPKQQRIEHRPGAGWRWMGSSFILGNISMSRGE